jgi:ankyrin repeat protein
MMDSFASDVFRISLGNTMLQAYGYPLKTDMEFVKEFMGLYQEGFFLPSKQPVTTVAPPPMAAPANPDEQLITAVTKKDMAGVTAALALGAHSDAVDRNGKTALKLAAVGGDLAIVQTLLDAHATVDAHSDQSHITALFIAAALGHTQVVERLLAGADRNVTDKSGTNLLMAAAASGSAGLVDLLLPLEFDVNAKRKEGGETALDFALGRYHWAVVGRLFEKGATLDSSKVGRADILSSLLKREEREKVSEVVGLPVLDMNENVADADVDLFKKAIALGAPIDARDKDGSTWLMRAAAAHHVAGVTAMLAAGNGVNVRNAKAESALLLDARQTPRETGRNFLLRIAGGLGKALNYPPCEPALDSSKSLGTAHRLQVARLLIAAGAEVNAADSLSRTPLSVAVETGDAELVSILLQAGAKVEGSGKYRHTPLGIAAQLGFVEVIKVLMAAHADPKAKNPKGETPLDLASKADQDHDTLVQMVQVETKEQMAKDPKNQARLNSAIEADKSRKRSGGPFRT